MRKTLLRAAVLVSAVVLGTGPAIAAAQQADAAPQVQTAEQSLAEDARQYAARHAVPIDEAQRRLGAQQDSVAVTDRIAAALGHRLAGISIEHQPQYRIVVLVTGTEPVAEQVALAAGAEVPVVFQLGAKATRSQVVEALRQHQPALKAAFRGARGMGLDPRTGELVLLVKASDAAGSGAASIQAGAEAITGVPVRVAIADQAKNLVRGGSRLVGTDEAGKRYACTTGFVVRDATRTGVVTAAHCPNSVVYHAPDGRRVPLEYVGQWGALNQDVQVHVGGNFEGPLFYADRPNKSLRSLAGARARQSIRAGDFVCHYGETSGYSCSEVQLTDYAPPGDLCGGPCEPVWLTAGGPNCRNGDSGGPVFSGNIAFGILKGGSGVTMRCNFYYFMSVDFLPEGWSLVTQPVERSSGLAQPPSLR